MVSRRTFFSIVLMMAALFFLFQIFQILKTNQNDYDTNKYVEKQNLTQETAWTMDTTVQTDGDFVVYIGKSEGEQYEAVLQWCQYTKRTLYAYDSLSAYAKVKKENPEVILFDGQSMNLETDVDIIWTYVKTLGISVIFTTLPDCDAIQSNSTLMELLGITWVASDNVTLTGIHLFEGLLLGGETYYAVDMDADQTTANERQDLELNVPWYVTLYNTKTYMVGMVASDAIENEYLPPIIWRNSIDRARVFAVNGNYITGNLGIGLLDGMLADMKEYEIYPVVNAQNLTIANFGGFSNENEEALMEIYSRDEIGVFQNIVLPGLFSIVEKCSAKPTYCFMPQYDYADGAEPVSDSYETYMRQINEQSGEAGWSMVCKAGTDLTEKVTADADYVETLDTNYVFSAFYTTKEQLEVLAQVTDATLFENLQTVSVGMEEDDTMAAVSYFSDGVTAQAITNDSESHTFMDDLQLKGVESALAYANALIDLKNVAFPRSAEDQWEILGEKIFSNLYSYWGSYKTFEKTTLSESDGRIRNFLALDYEYEAIGDRVALTVTNVSGETWFIMRTHDKEIVEITGGSYEQVETDVYLICAKESKVILQMKNSD